MTGKNANGREPPSEPSSHVIRRFFDLIARFEGRKLRIETKSARAAHATAKLKARIRRVGDGNIRH